MDIKCWGSRGSIPVSGKEYIKYGGDTTCIEITAKSGETIIVDAGTGIRRLGNSLIERHILSCHLLFTHVHWDHIQGLAFFKPLQFKTAEIIIQDRRFCDINTRDVLNEVLKQPFFPIAITDLNAKLVFNPALENRFRIGSVDVETIPTSHPGGGLGYKFTEDGASLVFMTDNELGFVHPGGRTFDDYQAFVADADLLIHDGEYTPEEYQRNVQWGHSNYLDVLELAVKSDVRQLGLFHQNQNRTDDEVDAMVTVCRAALKKRNLSLDCFAVACDMDFHL